jgi:hypothetical protein
MGKIYSCYNMCTWSPNEVAHCLVSSARRVGVPSVIPSVIANHVVPRRKLQHVIFSLVLHVGNVTTLATVDDGDMLVFLRAVVVPGFVNDDVMLIVICKC